MNSDINYIVVAPSFNENSGGTIFLHELTHALVARGERAALWPMPPVYEPGLRARLREVLRPAKYRCNPDLDTPLAAKSDIGPNTVVVYPELVRGNPVGAPNVVRWLLYTPGKKHPYQFGDDDMFFRVDEFADLPEITGTAPDLFLWKVNRSYRNENRPDRNGACFIVRKGRDLPRHPLTENAIQIDGKSHFEINDIFNRCGVFYSYDDATMYSQYAAVCGCLSVVLPSGDRARDDMLADHMLGRYGIAYGLEREKLDHARNTQHEVLPLLLQREAEGQRSVDRFVALTKERFAPRSK